MHSLYFVKIRKAEDAKDAKMQAIQALDMNGFSGEGGYFNSSKADWYVVGGRWSGTLSQLLVTKEKMLEGREAIKPLVKKYLKKTPDLLDYLHINEHLINKDEKLMTAIDNAFKAVTGFVYFRNSYAQGGYDDDAMQITPEILKALQTDEYNEVEVFEADDMEEFTVKDLPVNISGQWLVVIDYHM